MALITIYEPNSNLQSVFGTLQTDRLLYRVFVLTTVKSNLKSLGVPVSKRDYIACELCRLFFYDDGVAFTKITSFFVAIRNHYKTQGFTEKNVDHFCIGILNSAIFDYKNLDAVVDKILSVSLTLPI